MTSDLFQLLEINKIKTPPDASAIINSMQVSAVANLVNECHKIITSMKHPAPRAGEFNFSVSNSVSGSVYPCTNMECRINCSYELSLFSILYADRVTIPNLIADDYRPTQMFKSEIEKLRYKGRVANDIAIILNYRPLIEAGILSLNSMPDMCDKHLQEWTEVDVAGVISQMNNRWDEVEKVLIDEIIFDLESPNKLLISSRSASFVNSGAFIFSKIPDDFKVISKTPHRFSIKEVRDFDLIRKYVGNIAIRDLIIHKISPDTKNSIYLTKRLVDEKLIEGIQTVHQDPEIVVRGLQYTLPFLQDVDLRALINLRESESDFKAFRYALSDLIKESAKEPDSKKREQMMGDIMSRAIFDIERRIKNNSEFISEKGRNMSVISLLASIGGFGAHFLGGFMSEVVTGIGAGLVGSTVGELSTINIVPLEVRNSDYYFLWNVKRALG